MIEIYINKQQFIVKSGMSILEACKLLGIQIPRFCYHEFLSVSGNCRMCLIEIEGTEKPVASCVLNVEENMRIILNSPFVKKARENVLEMLLLNHPLDCPICDQGGECDLQDETKMYSSDYSRYFYNKRSVEDKNCGDVIKTVMTRCIHCTRCVRYFSEVVGVSTFGTMGRGRKTEVGGYTQRLYHSAVSGNVIDICPVGALTSNISAFKVRPWELEQIEDIDTTDGQGQKIYVEISNKNEVQRILPRNSTLNLNTIVSDSIRYGYSERNTVYYSNVYPSLFSSRLQFEYKTDEKILFLIDEHLDLQSLLYLKRLSEDKHRKITVKSIRDFNRGRGVLYSNDTVSSIEKVKDICIIVGVDLGLESPNIDVFLRKKVNDENLKVYQLGGGMIETNFRIKQLNYNIYEGFESIKDPNSQIHSELKSASAPVFIFGDNSFCFQEYFVNISMFLKTKFPNCRIIRLRNKPNSESVYKLDIRGATHRDIQDAGTIFAVNLLDTTRVRKLLLTNVNILSRLVWINCFLYDTETKLKDSQKVRVLSSNQKSEFYMNLEGLVQKTSVIEFVSNAMPNTFEFLINAFKMDKRLFAKYFSKVGFAGQMLSNYYYNDEKKPQEFYNNLERLFSYRSKIILVTKKFHKTYDEDPFLVGRKPFTSLKVRDLSWRFQYDKTNFVKISQYYES